MWRHCKASSQIHNLPLILLIIITLFSNSWNYFLRIIPFYLHLLKLYTSRKKHYDTLNGFSTSLAFPINLSKLLRHKNWHRNPTLLTFTRLGLHLVQIRFFEMPPSFCRTWIHSIFSVCNKTLHRTQNSSWIIDFWHYAMVLHHDKFAFKPFPAQLNWENCKIYIFIFYRPLS